MVDASGNTLEQLARALAQTLGPYSETVTAADSPSATVLRLGTNPMIDSEAPPERYGGHYAYIASGTYQGQQCRVRRDGYNGATGDLTLANPVNTLGGYNVQSGTHVELHGTMPRIDQDGLASLRTCINRAISKLWVVDRITMAATSGILIYELGGYWWMQKRRVKRLYDPSPAGQLAMVAGQGWEVRQDGPLWLLELGAGYPTGQTFSLEVERPLNSRLRYSGVWGDQASPTAGLQADTDACLGEWNAVYQCCLYECYQQLAVQAGGAAKTRFATKAAEQRVVVSTIGLWDAEGVDPAAPGGGASGVSSWTTAIGMKGLFA